MRRICAWTGRIGNGKDNITSQAASSQTHEFYRPQVVVTLIIYNYFDYLLFFIFIFIVAIIARVAMVVLVTTNLICVSGCRGLICAWSQSTIFRPQPSSSYMSRVKLAQVCELRIGDICCCSFPSFSTTCSRMSPMRSQNTTEPTSEPQRSCCVCVLVR